MENIGKKNQPHFLEHMPGRLTSQHLSHFSIFSHLLPVYFHPEGLTLLEFGPEQKKGKL